MKLEQANEEKHWVVANEMLSSVSHHLAIKGLGLWNADQIGIVPLKSCYKLDELYFARKGEETVGLVFIQESDDKFWPETIPGESLFFHKLAVAPGFQGKGYGYDILDRIAEMAVSRSKTWLRLDCDNRVGLRKFYQGYGFQAVDEKLIDGFNIVRFQMSVKFSSKAML
ncbi:MAG TPA: GNAT family N-acetyltransferase [Gammaproteobacteria bacterium]